MVLGNCWIVRNSVTVKITKNEQSIPYSFTDTQDVADVVSRGTSLIPLRRRIQFNENCIACTPSGTRESRGLSRMVLENGDGGGHGAVGRYTSEERHY